VYDEVGLLASKLHFIPPLVKL